MWLFNMIFLYCYLKMMQGSYCDTEANAVTCLGLQKVT